MRGKGDEAVAQRRPLTRADRLILSPLEPEAFGQLREMLVELLTGVPDFEGDGTPRDLSGTEFERLIALAYNAPYKNTKAEHDAVGTLKSGSDKAYGIEAKTFKEGEMIVLHTLQAEVTARIRAAVKSGQKRGWRDETVAARAGQMVIDYYNGWLDTSLKKNSISRQNSRFAMLWRSSDQRQLAYWEEPYRAINPDDYEWKLLPASIQAHWRRGPDKGAKAFEYYLNRGQMRKPVSVPQRALKINLPKPQSLAESKMVNAGGRASLRSFERFGVNPAEISEPSAAALLDIGGAVSLSLSERLASQHGGQANDYLPVVAPLTAAAVLEAHGETAGEVRTLAGERLRLEERQWQPIDISQLADDIHQALQRLA